MGRTHLARTTIVELRRRLKESEKRREELANKLKEIKKQYHQKQISHESYLEHIYKKIGKRTIHEWIEYYEKYIEYCEKKIKEERKILIKNKFTIIISSLFLLSLLIGVVFFIQPRFIGFAVQQQEFT